MKNIIILYRTYTLINLLSFTKLIRYITKWLRIVFRKGLSQNWLKRQHMHFLGEKSGPLNFKFQLKVKSFDVLRQKVDCKNIYSEQND